jgi:hypothetical protein
VITGGQIAIARILLALDEPSPAVQKIRRVRGRPERRVDVRRSGAVHLGKIIDLGTSEQGKNPNAPCLLEKSSYLSNILLLCILYA